MEKAVEHAGDGRAVPSSFLHSSTGRLEVTVSAALLGRLRDVSAPVIIVKRLACVITLLSQSSTSVCWRSTPVC